MKYRAIIFDVFGTLVALTPPEKYKATLAQMSDILSIRLEDFQRLWDKEVAPLRYTGHFDTIEAGLEYICRSLGMGVEPLRIQKAAQIRIDFTRELLHPRADAVHTLQALKQRGLKIGIISDCSPDLPILWNETPFAQYTDITVFSCQVGFQKPDARIYQMACTLLEVRPQYCFYIGDGGSHELSGATRVGMEAALLRVLDEETYARRQDALEWQGAVLSSLSEVLDVL
jgi:putative hydrolase of the HAD superfamily